MRLRRCPVKDKAKRKPLAPVLCDRENWLVCARCLVKWARVRGVHRVFCNTCARSVPHEIGGAK